MALTVPPRSPPLMVTWRGPPFLGSWPLGRPMLGLTALLTSGPQQNWVLSKAVLLGPPPPASTPDTPAVVVICTRTQSVPAGSAEMSGATTTRAASRTLPFLLLGSLPPERRVVAGTVPNMI